MGNDSGVTHIDRNPAIELYRILLMFLIVLGHVQVHGYWSFGDGLAGKPLLVDLLVAFIVWHVDGFLSITGWFGTRFSLCRFVKLWGTIVFYSVVSIGYGYFVNGKIPRPYFAGGWFGHTYLFFLFLVPLLNAALENLVKDKRKMYLAWAIFDSGFFLNWCPTHLLSGVSCYGTGGFSITTFIVVYVNVRLLKMSGLYERISLKMIMWVFCSYMCALLSFAVVKSFVKIGVSGMCWPVLLKEIEIGSYDDPHVMLMAIAALLLFAKFVKAPHWSKRCVAAVSPLMFGVYVIHDTTSFGRQIYRIPQTWMATHLGWHPMLIIFLSAIGCFMICIAVDGLRRVAVKPFARWVMPKIQRLDNKIGLR